jgi:hypothetical protein
MPDHVLVTISGWPSILDSVRAKINRKGVQLDLTLDQVRSSILRKALGPKGAFTFPEKPGSSIGSLTMKPGAPVQFKRSPGLAHYTTRVLQANADHP